MKGIDQEILSSQELISKQGFRITNQGKGFSHVASIDIGTNSTHLLIAGVDPILKTFNVELTEKSTTRLGERDLMSGELTEVAMIRVLDALKRFKELAESYKVANILITATSAVREAPNGNAFIKEVKDKLDFNVDLVSGFEEARLIYLGVLSGMTFGDHPHYLVDIGGGSTELILADAHDARALTSTKVGAVTLQNNFIQNENISEEKYYFIRSFIKGSLESAINKVRRRVRSGEKPLMIATSGTAMAIGSLAIEDEIKPFKNLQGYKVRKEKVDLIVEKLLKMNSYELKGLSSISERRAEIIVPGALILQATMEMLEVEEFVLSERALREGLVVDWMFRQGLFEDRFSIQGNIRHRTVFHQAQRFCVDVERSKRLANYALTIYDKTSGTLHTDNGAGRDLLWAAAILHSCGMHINLSSYHKHSWYLIKNGELLGYSQEEHLMVAAIARYHRKSFPKKRHESWQLIDSRDNRKIVLEMSLILRMASALDRRPDSYIAGINIQLETDEVIIQLVPKVSKDNLELEKWSLGNVIQGVEKLKNIKIKVL